MKQYPFAFNALSDEENPLIYKEVHPRGLKILVKLL